MDALSTSIADIITSTRDLFHRIWSLLTGSKEGGAADTGGGTFAPMGRGGTNTGIVPGQGVPTGHGGTREVITPPAASPPAATPPAQTPPTIPSPFQVVPGKGAMFQQFGGNQFAAFGGGRSTSMAASFGGGRSTNLAFAGGGGGGGGRQAFASAANRAAPGGGGLNAMFNRQNNVLMAGLGGAGAGGGRGGLDINNWQHSRTTNFTVRDVPGSNIHMAATGMA